MSFALGETDPVISRLMSVSTDETETLDERRGRGDLQPEEDETSEDKGQRLPR
jgi:hypothetical protein